MRRAIRKQTRNDFERRVQRLDPRFAAMKPSARVEQKPWEPPRKTAFKKESPFLMTGLGMILAMSALFAITYPDAFRTLLLQSGWPAQFLGYAMNGAAIISVGLMFLLFGNVVRIFNPNATGRWNAGGLVVGGLAGVMAFNLPATYVEASYAMLGISSATDVLDFAQERTLQFANIDWASVVMVSSSAK